MTMKHFNAKCVSATVAGDIFRVMFEQDDDSLENYFLIQRNFEFAEIDELNRCTIESDDTTFCGSSKIGRVEFSENRFYIRLADDVKNELEITYNTSKKNYEKVKKVLSTILSDQNCLVIQ